MSQTIWGEEWHFVILICYDSMSMFSNALSLYITPQAAVPYQMTIIVINIVNTLVLQPAVYVSRETYYSTLSSSIYIIGFTPVCISV